MPNLLAEQIDRLAAFAPTELPVISLYLNAQSDDHGRDHFASFVKKEQTGARFRLIEDAPLLAEVGGVGASLRYRE